MLVCVCMCMCVCTMYIKSLCMYVLCVHRGNITCTVHINIHTTLAKAKQKHVARLFV